MKKLFTIFAVFAFFASSAFSEELFNWARVKFADKKDGEDQWDVNLGYDAALLDGIEKLSTLKTNKKVNIVSFNDLEEITKYPVLFMHASGTPLFSEKEKKNLKEYLSRGGFLFVDDCHNQALDNLFYRGMRRVLEELFPGKKCETLKPSHEIFHSHFELAKGIGSGVGANQPVLGMSDDKGRLMAILMTADLHCSWGSDNKNDRFKQDSYRMVVNIIIYTLTH